MKIRYKDTSTIDELESLLKKSPVIENLRRRNFGDERYQRIIEFEVREQTYKIIWFVNSTTLYIGEFELLFDEVNIENTYPRRSKNFLQFYRRSELIAALPLERWETI